MASFEYIEQEPPPPPPPTIALQLTQEEAVAIRVALWYAYKTARGQEPKSVPEDATRQQWDKIYNVVNRATNGAAQAMPLSCR